MTAKTPQKKAHCRLTREEVRYSSWDVGRATEKRCLPQVLTAVKAGKIGRQCLSTAVWVSKDIIGVAALMNDES